MKTDDGWGVRGEGNQMLTSRHTPQRDAIAEATQIAKHQRSELIIQGEDGKIRARNSYGTDPFPPKG